MAAFSQTMFSNAFSWMKMYEFRLKFHWSLFLRFQLTIFQHWFRYWLGADQATSHYLKRWWLVYWRIYASLGLNALKKLWNLQSHPMYHIFKSWQNESIWNFSFMESHSFISQNWWLSSLCLRCTTEYQYSGQYSYEYLVHVLVPEYEYKHKYYHFGTHEYKYQNLSTRVLRVRVLSTSTPALPGDTCVCNLISWKIFWIHS